MKHGTPEKRSSGKLKQTVRKSVTYMIMITKWE